MLSVNLLAGVKHIRGAICTRNIGILAPAMQKCADPIQQLFVDKIREYKQKSGGGNKLVDATPEVQTDLKKELERLARIFGGDGKEDMTQFPQLKWVDPAVDSINQQAPK